MSSISSNSDLVEVAIVWIRKWLTHANPVEHLEFI